MICVEIDELTPCLQDTFSGDIVETEVIKISRKSFLQKFNKRTKWYENWVNLSHDNEIYALVIKGTVDIQGLVAVRNDAEMRAAFVEWMVAAPHNNPRLTDNKRYLGVGGHLFAIAIDKSIEYGYGGEITGFAANRDLLEHYQKVFGAVHVGVLHQYQIVIPKEVAEKIKETYSYEWTKDEL